MEVDQVARDLARSALARIDAHERECTQARNAAADWRAAATGSLIRIETALTSNYNALNETIDTKVGGVYSRLWLFAGGIGAGMLAVIIALVRQHS